MESSLSQRLADSSCATFAWQRVFPIHRLANVAKTPLLVAVGLYAAGGRWETSTVGATLVLTALLWLLLYTLNESVDRVHEEGIAVPAGTLQVLAAGIAIVCTAAAFVSPLLGVFCVGMTFSQLAYCLSPMRWKRHRWGGILVSGAVNPMLRLLCGATWGPLPLPWTLLIVVVCIHLGTAIRSRTLLRARDSNLGYATLPETYSVPGVLFSAAGVAGVFLLAFQGVLPRVTLLFALIGLLYSIYMWGYRRVEIQQLRTNWIGFATLSIAATCVLLGLVG